MKVFFSRVKTHGLTVHNMAGCDLLETTSIHSSSDDCVLEDMADDAIISSYDMKGTFSETAPQSFGDVDSSSDEDMPPVVLMDVKQRRSNLQGRYCGLSGREVRALRRFKIPRALLQLTLAPDNIIVFYIRC